MQLLTVCRLVEKKGVDTLIAALVDLRDRHGINCRLTVAGDGPDRNRLTELSKQLHCADEIEWLGAVENERVLELLGRADVFALPCRVDSRGDRDGIPVVLMEAMAAGVTVISGDLPAIRELIQNGSSGLLVNGQDATALADQLANVARDSDLRSRLAQAGRARVGEEFSLDLNIDRLEQLLLRTTGIRAVGEENDTSGRRKSKFAVGA